ncbi:LysR family transcriptional regulator [Chitinivorax sp. B]|uniref:LysR family transcriptional regulator n=1 Tax=Chitinivorax sp. B TaxID=2502235 RepID=UPI0010F520A8|nr:LysR family transcriptional regulator [Chitinivorax sp. B]
MLDDLRALAVFAKTVELGSFRAAAVALDLSPSVVSHHVSQLEARLGAALLYRSTRRLSLTADGESLLVSAQAMLQAAEAGLDTMAHRSVTSSGRLRLTLPAFFAHSPLLLMLADFARQFPNVTLSMQFSDVKQDLIRDGIDLAIRIGELADSGLKSRKLFVMTRVLVAAPALMACRPMPDLPDDLQHWDWIGLAMRPNHKWLVKADGQQTRIEFIPQVVVDSLAAACQLAEAGLGLATPPLFMVAEALQAGRLQNPLPDWQVPPLDVFAVWPANAPKAGLTQRLVAFLVSRLQSELA